MIRSSTLFRISLCNMIVLGFLTSWFSKRLSSTYMNAPSHETVGRAIRLPHLRRGQVALLGGEQREILG